MDKCHYKAIVTDYAKDCKYRESVSGVVVCMNGIIVWWICKKQANVALSTMEEKSVESSLVTSELLGMCDLLDEIKIKVEAPMIVHVDNKMAIKQITGEDSSGRAKQNAVKHNFVKDYNKKGVINVVYCESKMMRADVVTKTLAATRTTRTNVSSVKTSREGLLNRRDSWNTVIAGVH